MVIYIIGFLIWGCDIVTRMGISSAQMKKEPYVRKVDAVAQEVAELFVDAIDKGELGSPKFRHLMNFVAMQNMTRNQQGTKNYEYWLDRDWLDAPFYTDAPINPFARLLAGYISRKMRRAMRKGNVQPHR